MLNQIYSWKNPETFTTSDFTPPAIQTSAPELMFVSIIPANIGREEFTVNLIRNRYRCTKIKYYAMCYSMHPSGADPMQKPLSYVPSFTKIKEMLADDSDIVPGILIQSTIGHGGYWNSSRENGLQGQKLILSDGRENHRFCAYEKNFTDYITEAISTVAALKPAFMIIDDDLRPYADSCYCPEHLKRLNALTGRNFTRESLAEYLKNAPPYDEISKAFYQINAESIGVIAQAIRKGIDRHDKSISCAYCACHPFINVSEEILANAGGDKPLFLRMSNSYYTEKAVKVQADKDLLTAFQTVNFKKQLPNVPLIDESDTCPHDRFSKSARTMNLHIASSILHGCRGGKLWFDNFSLNVSDNFEMIFARYNGLYRELAALMDKYTPEGPLTVIPPFEQKPYPHEGTNFSLQSDWGNCAFGKMGLPVSYGDINTRNVHLLAGNQVDYYTDSDLRKILSGNAIIDGAAAIKLTERGFAARTGVSAAHGKTPANGEKILSSDIRCRFNSADHYAELTPEASAEILSMLTNQGVEVLPGSVLFKNDDGGKIISLALDVGATVPMNVLNPARKMQFTEMLEKLDGIPAALAAFQDSKFMCGKLDDGRLLWTAVNYSYDPLPLEFASNIKAAKILELMPDGSYRNVDFVQQSSKISINKELEPAEFSILVIEY